VPRVKLVYQEAGEWAPATGQIGTCKHPREMLRFDGSFGTPSFMYCRACGTRYLSPYHGMTQEDIDEAREHARLQLIEWGLTDEEGNLIDD
jgi:hypothetical protein